MTTIEAAVTGALTVIGLQCVSASIIVRALTRTPEAFMLGLADVLAAVAKGAGYEHLVVSEGEEAFAVRFDDIPRALRHGDVLTHAATELKEGACDGRA